MTNNATTFILYYCMKDIDLGQSIGEFVMLFRLVGGFTAVAALCKKIYYIIETIGAAKLLEFLDFYRPLI